jgi:hypothetical protein
MSISFRPARTARGAEAIDTQHIIVSGDDASTETIAAELKSAV